MFKKKMLLACLVLWHLSSVDIAPPTRVSVEITHAVVETDLPSAASLPLLPVGESDTAHQLRAWKRGHRDSRFALQTVVARANSTPRPADAQYLLRTLIAPLLVQGGIALAVGRLLGLPNLGLGEGVALFSGDAGERALCRKILGWAIAQVVCGALARAVRATRMGRSAAADRLTKLSDLCRTQRILGSRFEPMRAIAVALMLACFAGASELAFRGVVQRALITRLGFLPSVLLSASLSALSRRALGGTLPGSAGLTAAFVHGLAMSLIFARTRDVSLCVTAHAVHDVASLLSTHATLTLALPPSTALALHLHGVVVDVLRRMGFSLTQATTFIANGGVQVGDASGWADCGDPNLPVEQRLWERVLTRQTFCAGRA